MRCRIVEDDVFDDGINAGVTSSMANIASLAPSIKAAARDATVLVALAIGSPEVSASHYLAGEIERVSVARLNARR